MIQNLLRAGAVLALGSLAFTGEALAASPVSSASAVPLVILAQDQENEEVWQDLRPDVTPPEAAVGKKEEKGSAAEAPLGEGSGDVENEEVERDLRTEEAPPAGE